MRQRHVCHAVDDASTNHVAAIAADVDPGTEAPDAAMDSEVARQEVEMTAAGGCQDGASDGHIAVSCAQMRPRGIAVHTILDVEVDHSDAAAGRDPHVCPGSRAPPPRHAAQISGGVEKPVSCQGTPPIWLKRKDAPAVSGEPERPRAQRVADKPYRVGADRGLVLVSLLVRGCWEHRRLLPLSTEINQVDGLGGRGIVGCATDIVRDIRGGYQGRMTF